MLERVVHRKKILITGAGSYIGTAVEAWLMKNPEKYQVETIDMTDDNWRKKEFSGYDVVYHVAGIVHADVGSVSEEVKKKYYRVNTDLAVETAEKAKNEGVKQFIFYVFDDRIFWLSVKKSFMQIPDRNH